MIAFFYFIIISEMDTNGPICLFQLQKFINNWKHVYLSGLKL